MGEPKPESSPERPAEQAAAAGPDLERLTRIDFTGDPQAERPTTVDVATIDFTSDPQAERPTTVDVATIDFTGDPQAETFVVTGEPPTESRLDHEQKRQIATRVVEAVTNVVGRTPHELTPHVRDLADLMWSAIPGPKSSRRAVLDANRKPSVADTPGLEKSLTDRAVEGFLKLKAAFEPYRRVHKIESMPIRPDGTLEAGFDVFDVINRAWDVMVLSGAEIAKTASRAGAEVGVAPKALLWDMPVLMIKTLLSTVEEADRNFVMDMSFTPALLNRLEERATGRPGARGVMDRSGTEQRVAGAGKWAADLVWDSLDAGDRTAIAQELRAAQRSGKNTTGERSLGNYIYAELHDRRHGLYK